MADRIEELFLKEYTQTELENATRHDFTTNSSTAYVIKDIEFKQGSDNQSVSGTVTVGKTSDLSAGKFSKLGQFGSLVDSLSGSAIMDADSTLSIRPTATTSTYKDETVFLENGGASNNNSVGPLIQLTTPTVNGFSETGITTTLTANNPGTGDGNYNSWTKEYAIVHTTANNIKIYMRFYKGSSAYSYVNIVGMDNGTDYAALTSTYTEHVWDGERYIYWYDGGYIYFFDTDNANITNPATHGVTCHGRMQTNFAGSAQSYDHRFAAYHVSAHDGKKYFSQYFNSQSYGVIFEMPTTTSDGATCPKRWRTGNGSYHGSGTDPFGNNSGNAWTPYYLTQQVSRNEYSMEQISTFTDKLGVKRWMMWRRHDAYRIWLFTWRDQDMQSLANNGILGSNDPNMNSSQGIRCIALGSVTDAALGWNATYFSGNTSNAFISSATANLGAGNSDLQNNSYGTFYVDGLTLFFSNVSQDYNVFKIDLTKTSFPGLFTSGQYNPYHNNYYVQFSTPSASTIASRTYLNAPALTVRATGIKEDRS